MTRTLAARLRRGIALDNLDPAISEFESWSSVRPDVGGVVVGILRSIRDRWTSYPLPSAEYRRVHDAVVPRVLEILRKVDEVPGYVPLADLVDLQTEYASLS